MEVAGPPDMVRDEPAARKTPYLKISDRVIKNANLHGLAFSPEYFWRLCRMEPPRREISNPILAELPGQISSDPSEHHLLHCRSITACEIFDFLS
jgi:hypothetical protein